MLHVLLLASDHLGYRILEQLRRDGCRVTVVAPDESWLARTALPADVEVVRVDAARPDIPALPAVATADALVAVTDHDELNLGVALAALEVNPRLRVVLRQFNLRLGRLLAANLPRCETLSLSALAAPAFALAALTPGVVFAHAFAEETLVLREQPEGAPDAAGAVVARAGGRVLVATSERGLSPHPEPERHPVSSAARRRHGTNWLLVWTLTYLACVVVASTLYFELRLGMGFVDALYFVVTTITSVGFGDFNLREEDAVSKLVGMGLMLSGVMSMAVLFAVLTNRLFARQDAWERGQVHLRTRGHVVVCGLGVIGFRVAQALKRLGHKVVIVEANENGRFVADARAEGIPVIVGDATSEQALRFANAAYARAVVVCTNPDHQNIEIALNARSMIGGVPIVLRLFDPDLSRRVATHFHLEATFSSAALGAVRFAAAATGSTRLAVVRFDDRDYEIHRVAATKGEAVAACRQRVGGAAIAVVDARGRLRFRPADASLLSEGESLVVVVTT